MPTLTLLRLLSVLGVVWLQTSSGLELVNAVFTIGMAHYVLSTFYARRNIVASLSRLPSSIGLAGLTAAAAWLWWVGYQIVIIFMPHHVFNEVYMTKKELPSLRLPPTYILSAIVLNTLLYCQFVDLTQFCPIYISNQVMAGVTVVAIIWFVFNWLALVPIMVKKHLIDACSVELGGIVLLFLMGPGRITFYQVVLYHFALWAMYPLVGYWKTKSFNRVRSYIFVNVAVFSGAVLLSPQSPLPWHFSLDAWYKLFYAFSFFHIITSFGLSRAQPEWMCRLFLPASNTVATVPPVVSEKVAAAVR